MLVRDVYTEVQRGPDGEILGVVSGERMVEMPALTAEEAAAQQAALQAQEDALAGLREIDRRRSRAMGDALLCGLDTEVGGSTARARLAEIEQQASHLRALLV